MMMLTKMPSALFFRLPSFSVLVLRETLPRLVGGVGEPEFALRWKRIPD